MGRNAAVDRDAVLRCVTAGNGVVVVAEPHLDSAKRDISALAKDMARADVMHVHLTIAAQPRRDTDFSARAVGYSRLFGANAMVSK